MTVLKVSRSAYGSSISIHGLIRNLKFIMARGALSKPNARPKTPPNTFSKRLRDFFHGRTSPGGNVELPDVDPAALSTIRTYRQQRWAKRRASRPLLSKSIMTRHYDPTDIDDFAEWDCIRNRFMGETAVWLTPDRPTSQEVA